MSAAGPLSTMFLAGMAEGARASWRPGTGLEGALARLVETARGAWVEFEVKDADFLAYVAARATDEAALAAVRGGDLYAACACVRGDARAVGAVRARYLPAVRAALARMKLPADKERDALQLVEGELFAGDGRTPPRIAEYSGRGELGAWLRVVAMRAGLKLVRKSKRERPLDEAQLGGLIGDDIELGQLKRAFRAHFDAAFREALESLDDRDATYLRQHTLDGLTIDELAALYKVHRATAARWVGRARDHLLESTRAGLMKRARVNASECNSIMRLLRSQLDVTLRRYLVRTSR